MNAFSIPTEFTINVKLDFSAFAPALVQAVVALQKLSAPDLSTAGSATETAPPATAVTQEPAPSAPETSQATDSAPVPPTNLRSPRSRARREKPAEAIPSVQPIEGKHEQVEGVVLDPSGPLVRVVPVADFKPAPAPMSVPGFDDPAPAPSSGALDLMPATEEEVRALKTKVLELMPIIGDERYSKLRVELAGTLKAQGYAPELDGHGRVTFKTLTRGMVRIVEARFAEVKRGV